MSEWYLNVLKLEQMRVCVVSVNIADSKIRHRSYPAKQLLAMMHDRMAEKRSA